MSKTHEGYLLIADITGYTRYLSESELEHAQDTLKALLELLVQNTRSPLVISRLAGDAVISYGLLEDFFHGQTFVEKIEDTYVTFRKALDRLVINNTCRCSACANISRLDLKFFIHYGTFGIQRIGDYDELVGNDINLLHRLLKNSVTEETGLRAYALFTGAAIRQLDLEDIVKTMTFHSEAYEYLGEVQVFLLDMHAVWERKRSTTVVTFPQERLLDRSEVYINMPRERVWDYMVRPEFRTTLIGSDRMEIINRSHGRITTGSVYQCYHGDKWVPQTILEWQPFERMITSESTAFFRDLSAIVEYRLDSTEKGTRLSKLFARPTGHFFARTLIRLLAPVFSRFVRQDMESFKLEIENDYMEHSKSSEQETEFIGEQISKGTPASLQASSGSLQT